MFLKRFFYYPKNDRRGMALLVGVIIVAAVVFIVIKRPFAAVGDEYKEVTDDYKNGYDHRRYNRNYSYKNYQRRAAAELFQFDPNMATAEDFMRLGLYDWQARNVMKYRAKGGTFHKPSDFAKIYGLSREQFTTLEPYIYISDEFRYTAHNVQKDSAPRVVPHYVDIKIKEGESISLNSADTSELKKVPGIGSYFARKIVQYRERLGGFVNARQLEEIEGVPASAEKFMKVEAANVRKINLNSATVRQMNQHPYMNYAQAKQIEGFRRMKGRLHSVVDLRVMSSFSASDISRLAPYITF